MENAPYELTRKQRMMIKKRKALKKKPAVWILAIVIAVLMAAVICLQYIPFGRANTYAATGDNIVLTMDFVGDVMLARNIKENGEMHGYAQYYRYVTDYWKNADLAFANLESTVLKKNGDYSEAKKTKNSIYLAASRTGLKSLLYAGINGLSCANNHSGDYGKKPVGELCDYLDDYSDIVTYAGIGRNIDEASAYKVIEKNGIKVGFVSITETYYSISMARPESEGVLTTGHLSYNKIVSDAAKESDLVVVYIHFGEENETKSNAEQQTYAHMLIDAGADIVIGSHPHVLQDVELYNDGIIFYSLGNFIFDQGSTYSRDSVMVQYTLDNEGNGAFELIPVRIDNGIPSETSLAFFKARINRELSQSLDPGTYSYDDDGHIIINAVNLDLANINISKDKNDKNSDVFLEENEED